MPSSYDKSKVMVRVIDNSNTVNYFETTLREIEDCPYVLTSKLDSYNVYWTADFVEVKEFVLRLRMDKTVDKTIRDMIKD